MDVMRDRLRADRRVGMREAAEFVRQRMQGSAWVVLKRVGIHGIEARPRASACSRKALCRTPRPRENAARRLVCATQAVDHGAVFKFYRKYGAAPRPWEKRANRVPPVPTAQLGAAMAKALIFSVMASMPMPRRSSARASDA